MNFSPDAPLFGDAADGPGPRAEYWNRGLTQRTRVLLHTRPLHDLRSGDAHLDPDRRHYDSLALALKVIDLVVENTGLEYEVDRPALMRALTPMLLAMDAAAGVEPDPARHAVMVDRVVGALRNDEQGRRKFSIDYQDFDSRGVAVTRQLEFRLLADHFHPSGGTVLRASNGAINLYLNALELDIEDAQAAAEAVVQSQLARGKFDEAVQSARNARLHSLRLHDKLEGLLRETRRDVRRVDWRSEAPRIMQEGLAHIQTRLDAERGILATAEERLDSLTGQPNARKVSQIIALMKECRIRHLALHERLIGARNVFLQEQERQSFSPTPVLSMPALEAEVLEPVLRMGREQSLAIVSAGFPAFFGPRPVPSLSLAGLIGWQLRPRREQNTAEVSVTEPDLALSSGDAAMFPAGVRAEAAQVLAGIDGPVTLSTLLSKARAGGIPEEALRLVVLNILHDFDAEDAGPGALSIERAAGEAVNVPGFFGDEMLIGPGANDAGR